MEVVHAVLVRRRVAAAAIEARAQAALHRLDGRLVFHLDLVERGAGAAAEPVGVAARSRESCTRVRSGASGCTRFNDRPHG